MKYKLFLEYNNHIPIKLKVNFCNDINSLFIHWVKQEYNDNEEKIIDASNDEINKLIYKQLNLFPEFELIKSYGKITYDFVYKDFYDFALYRYYYVNVYLEILNLTQDVLFRLKYL